MDLMEWNIDVFRYGQIEHFIKIKSNYIRLCLYVLYNNKTYSNRLNTEKDMKI